MPRDDPPGWGDPAAAEPSGWGTPAGDYPPAGPSYPPPGQASGGHAGWGPTPGGGFAPPGVGPPWPSPWQGDQPLGEPPGQAMAVASLVVGIVSLPAVLTVVGGVLLGGIALGLGIAALRRSKRTGAPGRGLAIGGIVTGAAGLLLGGLVLAFAVVALSDSNFVTCVRHAAGSTAAIRHCETKLRLHLGGG